MTTVLFIVAILAIPLVFGLPLLRLPSLDGSPCQRELRSPGQAGLSF